MNSVNDTLDRFAAKLRVLRHAYSQTPKIFDVSHGFVEGTPLTEESLQQMETAHQLVLPDEYRAFLKRFGETPTGPGNYFNEQGGLLGKAKVP